MTPCREWQGSRTHNGYGERHIKVDGKWKTVRLHRWVVEQIEGPIPEGMVVMHLCHNRRCFRYDHLQVGTQSENLRMSAHNMGRDQQGTKNPSVRLTEEQVLEIFHSGDTQVSLASEYGICQSQVSNIKTGVSWSYLTGAESSVNTRRSAGEGEHSS